MVTSLAYSPINQMPSETFNCVPKLSLVYVLEHRLLYGLLNINERVHSKNTEKMGCPLTPGFLNKTLFFLGRYLDPLIKQTGQI